MRKEHSVAPSTIDDASVLISELADFVRELRSTTMQWQLPSKAGITRQGLDKILQCVSDPKLSTVLRLVKAMGCELRLVHEPLTFGLRHELHRLETMIEDGEVVSIEARAVLERSEETIKLLRQERRNTERLIARKTARKGDLR